MSINPIEDPERTDITLLTPLQRIQKIKTILITTFGLFIFSVSMFYEEVKSNYAVNGRDFGDRLSSSITRIDDESDRTLASVEVLKADLDRIRIISEKISDPSMRAYVIRITTSATQDLHSIQNSTLIVKGELSKLTQPQHAWNGVFVSVARADTPVTFIAQDPIVILAIMSVTIAFLGAFLLYLFTKDKKKMDFSETIIKTILGFYIGLVTGKIAK